MLENKFITVAIKGGPGSGRHPDEGKVERAKVSYIPMSKEKEKIATESEQVIVNKLNGEAVGDNGAYDVIVGKTLSTGKIRK